MRPNPSTPSTLSATSTPPHFERSQRPSTSAACACGTLRASASSSATVCSAAETTFDSGAFATTMPRRGVDVHVVDTDPRATDHAQVRAALDQVCSELRRRADDDCVVAADDLLERRVDVDVDVELRAQQLDACLRDLFADQYPHDQAAATGLSNASNAAGTATPRSMSAPSSVRDSSTAASALAMSNTSNQPMWPMRKIFPFRCCWPGASVTP